MSEVKHTPGPWEVVRNSQGYPYAIKAPNGNRGPGGIVNVTRWAAIGLPSSQEGEANALLIAAAPDLLAAAQAMMAAGVKTEMTYESAYHAMFKSPDGWNDLADAIAKATGQ